jgi:hypothetical protein
MSIQLYTLKWSCGTAQHGTAQHGRHSMAQSVSWQEARTRQDAYHHGFSIDRQNIHAHERCMNEGTHMHTVTCTHTRTPKASPRAYTCVDTPAHTCVEAVRGSRSNLQAAIPAASSCDAMCCLAVAHEKGLAFSTSLLVGMLHSTSQRRTAQHTTSDRVKCKPLCLCSKLGWGCYTVQHSTQGTAQGTTELNADPCDTHHPAYTHHPILATCKPPPWW